MALAFWGFAIRVHVYVDGFNLYYGALKGSAYKWLDVVALSQQLLPKHAVVEKVKYFTARVSGAADPDAPRRQQAYLSALASRPEVEIFYGRFLSKTTWRPLVNLPVAGAAIETPAKLFLKEQAYPVRGGSLARDAQVPVGTFPQKGAKRQQQKGPVRPLSDALIVNVHTMEEKGSDVNLGAHLLNDAWLGAYDAAAVISNDTDLCTPIRMVAQERGKPVFCVCPSHWRMAPDLEAVATYKRHIRPPMLAASQFPASIPNTAVVKPQDW